MNQDDVFLTGEGDAWFRRNREALERSGEHDWPLRMVAMLGLQGRVATAVELGCANGWRLELLRRRLGVRATGVDASADAIADGRVRFPGLDLRQGSLADLPLDETHDLTIVNFVLHWIDRASLATVVAGIDRVTRDGGLLILGDFLPDWPQRRPYHHREADGVHTFKQDYAAIFTALGTWREVARVTYDHDDPAHPAGHCAAGRRGVCVALRKSLREFYHHDAGHPAG